MVVKRETPKLTPAQRKLVEENVALAQFLAHRRWEMAPNFLDLEELIALAYQGLVTAAIRFDPERPDISPGDLDNGKAFSGFARQRILGSILDWQKKDADHVPRSYRADYKHLQRSGYPEKEKNYKALSLLTGLTEDRIRLVVAAVERMPVSLDQLAADVGDSMTPESSQNVEESVLARAISGAVASRIGRMTELQQTVLALKYYLALDLQEISKMLKVSASAVKEAHNTALTEALDAMVLAAQEGNHNGEAEEAVLPERDFAGLDEAGMEDSQGL